MLIVRSEGIGSLLRPRHLVEARERFERGELSAAAFKRDEDGAVPQGDRDVANGGLDEVRLAEQVAVDAGPFLLVRPAAGGGLLLRARELNAAFAAEHVERLGRQAERGEFAGRAGEQALVEQLVHGALNLLARRFLEQAVGAELVVAELEHALGFGAGEPDTPRIFIYDAYPGGIGFSRPLFTMHGEVLARTQALIAGCPCDNGCPSCVGPVGETGPLAKTVALRILDHLLGRRLNDGGTRPSSAIEASEEVPF